MICLSNMIRYAFEGIISAYEIAKIRRHDDALSDFEYIIDEGLYNLGRCVIYCYCYCYFS